MGVSQNGDTESSQYVASHKVLVQNWMAGTAGTIGFMCNGSIRSVNEGAGVLLQCNKPGIGLLSY